MRSQYKRFFIFSACRDNLDVNSNKQRTMEVARFLEESNVNFAFVQGVYKGSHEVSFMVLDHDQEGLVSCLCGLYNQECYLYRDNENEGFLVYPDNRKESLGKAKEVTREDLKGLDSYTMLPNGDGTKTYFTFAKEQ